jgi:hypothetical protein
MELLKRALANANRLAAAMTSSTFYAWFPSGSGVVETQISCMASTQDSADQATVGFLKKPQSDITIRIKLADLPGEAVPGVSTRFYAGPTGTRNLATRYQIESIKRHHLDDYIEIKGTKSK